MIVGFTGKAGSGKDTAADYLVQRHGFVKLSFASALKAGLNAMFGFTPKHWDDREWKETVIPALGKSPRQLAQTLGTEWGRLQVKEDLWPALTMHEASKHKNVVIADVRFDNEAQAIIAAGGLVIKLERTADDVASHVSEKPINPFLCHAIIGNVGRISTLHMDVASTLNHLVGGTAWQSE